MSFNIKTKILNLFDLDNSKRLIFISDIHGSVELFKDLLKKINFNDNDYLFLLGDMIEKSNHNLETLDYIIKLIKNGNVYALLGNCDNIYRYILNVEDPKLLLNFALVKGNSIINEMAKKLNISLTGNSDIIVICELFKKEFKHYFDFLASLPHVIETDKFILAHGGININEPNYGYNAVDIMKNDYFYLKSECFDKWVIVGHFPTINYCKDIPSFNPIIDQNKHLICIDGGNNVKQYGQINALIVDNLYNMDFSYTYVDSYQKVRIIKEQHVKNDNPVNIVYGENEVEVLVEFENYSHCLHPRTKLEFDIFNTDIYKVKDHLMCGHASNYYLNVNIGDIVSILNMTDELVLAKNKGVVGWLKKDCIGL